MAIQRKKYLEALKIQKEKAEEMNRLKSSFLANMSHELRTPMVAILGYADILKRDLQNNESKQMASEIFESGERLLRTLNSILDLSKIEANKLELNNSEINVCELTKEHLKTLSGLAKKKNLKLDVISNNPNCYCRLDSGLFRQVLNNLVGNAIKFTTKGGIKVIVMSETIEQMNWVSVMIEDTGIGIAEEKQILIFDEFRQASEGWNRGFDGSGLGLTITKRIVELMKGKISVTSTPGAGSTFKVSFPAIAPKPISQVHHNQETSSQVNEKVKKQLAEVLLVEDVSSNSDIIRLLLRGICKLDIVQSGEEAIHSVQKKKYATILMDIDLGPGLSGIEAVKRIRKYKEYEKTPIIAVTALAMKGHREQFLSEGCTHYISKPFKAAELKQLVIDVIADNNN
jgi:CheY-like chemotaxis protein